jgi:hypothetical protein
VAQTVAYRKGTGILSASVQLHGRLDNCSLQYIPKVRNEFKEDNLPSKRFLVRRI